MCDIPIKMILATDIGYGIGKNDKLPNWNLKGDLTNFKKLTKGNGNNFVVMGSNTWRSIGQKALIKRNNIVMSKTKEITNNVVVVKRSIEDVFEYVNKEKKEKSELWIIGGSQIYELFINYVSEIHWTRALKSYDCNIYLTIDLIKEMIIRQWKENHSELDSLESDGYQYCVWKKQ
tara:strand:+ start:242 stop:769 length:528 start_codon:yes stop_codon:yes gene_type:complete